MTLLCPKEASKGPFGHQYQQVDYNGVVYYDLPFSNIRVFCNNISCLIYKVSLMFKSLSWRGNHFTCKLNHLWKIMWNVALEATEATNNIEQHLWKPRILVKLKWYCLIQLPDGETRSIIYPIHHLLNELAKFFHCFSAWLSSCLYLCLLARAPLSYPLISPDSVARFSISPFLGMSPCARIESLPALRS